MTLLADRASATQRTMDRFRPKTFDWSRGMTCVHLARFHLTAMGHTVPTLPRFRSAFGAKRAMRERGWDSVQAMLDSLLPRIAPARMLVGDLATVPGTDGMDSILVCAGPFKVMGWHPDDGRFVVYDGGMEQISGAWRA